MASFLFLLAGCAREQMGDCFKGRGGDAVEQRYLAPFTALVLNDKVDVTIAQDTTLTGPVVAVMAGRNELPNIRTEVRDGALHIGNNMRCNWVRDMAKRPVVRITVAHLDRILNTGIGDVTGITPFHGDHFRLEQWDGHGTVTLTLHVASCHVELHTGVGDAVLSGTADQAYYYVSTLARVDAHGLEAGQVLVNNSGTCDILCRATDTLVADIHAMGDVYFGGNPDVVQAHITGSGQLVPLP